MNSLINTSKFLKASPEQRTDMVMKGYLHIATTIDSLADEVKILNGWLKLMPGMLANDDAVKPDFKEFEKIMQQGEDAGDKLSSHVIENVALLDELLKAIKFYNNII